MTKTGLTSRQWDLETDILVTGCGYAGAAAAIFAHDTEAQVLLLEKMRCLIREACEFEGRVL